MMRSIEPILSPFERYTLVPSTLSLPIRLAVSRRSTVCVAIASSCISLCWPLSYQRARAMDVPQARNRASRVTLTSVPVHQMETAMPRGDKSKYTDRQKRKAEHIEEGYEKRGVPEQEAERRAWATVNKEEGGGNKSGSGRGGADPHVASREGGRLGGRAGGQR